MPKESAEMVLSGADGSPSAPFVAAEYAALRGELLKRIEFRYQLVALTVTGAGIFLGVALKADAVVVDILLAYPPLAALLSLVWAYNGVVTLRIARYIQRRLEPRFGYTGWETSNKDLPLHSSRLGLASGLVFALAQVAVLVPATAAAMHREPIWRPTAFAIDCAIVAFTIGVALYHYRLQR